MTKNKKYLRQTKGIIYANTMSQVSARQIFGECEKRNKEEAKMKRYKKILVSLMLVGLLCGCGATGQSKGDSDSANQGAQAGTESNSGDEVGPGGAGGNVTEKQEEEKMVNPETYFERMMYATAYKSTMQCNPIMTQRFGADPYAMVYGDRVYFYMTADAFEYDAAGEIVENTYSKIRSINVVSTDDMVKTGHQIPNPHPEGFRV